MVLNSEIDSQQQAQELFDAYAAIRRKHGIITIQENDIVACFVFFKKANNKGIVSTRGKIVISEVLYAMRQLPTHITSKEKPKIGA